MNFRVNHILLIQNLSACGYERVMQIRAIRAFFFFFKYFIFFIGLDL